MIIIYYKLLCLLMRLKTIGWLVWLVGCCLTTILTLEVYNIVIKD